MNVKKVIIATVVAFVTIWVSDLLIHRVLLSNAYAATKSLWRPENEMLARMPWMLAGQLVVALGIALIYVAAIAEKACFRCAFFFGLSMGLYSTGGQMIMFTVAPYPGGLVAKWVAACLAQGVLVALVLFKVCKTSKTAVA